MDDPQGMSALGEKKRNGVVVRKQEATVAKRDGRRGDLMRLWHVCMDNRGGLWLQDRCVLPTLTVSSGRAFAEKLAGPLGMRTTQDPTFLQQVRVEIA